MNNNKREKSELEKLLNSEDYVKKLKQMTAKLKRERKAKERLEKRWEEEIEKAIRELKDDDEQTSDRFGGGEP